MPTWETAGRFERDLNKLDATDRVRFRTAVEKFIQGLRSGDMPAGLRVKTVEGTDGVFELTWAPDGRATWQYGDEQRPGEPHIVWRRVGTHDILKSP